MGLISWLKSHCPNPQVAREAYLDRCVEILGNVSPVLRLNTNTKTCRAGEFNAVVSCTYAADDITNRHELDGTVPPLMPTSIASPAIKIDATSWKTLHDGLTLLGDQFQKSASGVPTYLGVDLNRRMRSYYATLASINEKSEIRSPSV